MKKLKFFFALLLLLLAHVAGVYLIYLGWWPCGVVTWLFLILIANKLIRSS